MSLTLRDHQLLLLLVSDQGIKKSLPLYAPEFSPAGLEVARAITGTVEDVSDEAFQTGLDYVMFAGDRALEIAARKRPYDGSQEQV